MKMEWINDKNEGWQYGHVAEGYVYMELDEPNMSYSFNTFRVVKRLEDGALAFANDCGCSCPSPFEDYTSFERYERLGHDFSQLERAIESWNKGYDGKPYVDRGEVDEFLRAVKL